MQTTAVPGQRHETQSGSCDQVPQIQKTYLTRLNFAQTVVLGHRFHSYSDEFHMFWLVLLDSVWELSVLYFICIASLIRIACCIPHVYSRAVTVECYCNYHCKAAFIFLNVQNKWRWFDFKLFWIKVSAEYFMSCSKIFHVYRVCLMYVCEWTFFFI